jgi:hypothetical protein
MNVLYRDMWTMLSLRYETRYKLQQVFMLYFSLESCLYRQRDLGYRKKKPHL